MRIFRLTWLSTHRRRIAQILALSAYRSALLLPSILLLEIDRDVASIQKLVISLILLVCWHLSFRKPSHAVISMLPFFLILPFDLFFTQVYQEPPTTAIIGIVAHTTPKESLDYLNGRKLEIFLVLLLSLSVWASALWSIDSLMPTRPSRFLTFSRWVGRCVTVTWIAVLAWSFAAASMTPAFAGKSGSNAEKEGNLALNFSRLTGTFPFGRIFSVSDYMIGEQKAVALVEQLRDFSFGASTPPDQARQVYVLVIGETSRRDRYQIEGYGRQTNPRLSATPNLVALTNVVTPWTWTDASVPVIVSRKPATDRSRLFPQKSVVSLFKEAGFHTTWLSNQQRNSASSPLGLPAAEADEAHYLNVAANNVFGKTTYDEVMLPALRAILARPEPRQFIVVHLLGSHDLYEKRYPSGFDRWHASVKDGSEADNARQRLNDTYDNSILYTDYVISEIIGVLKHEKAFAGLYYVSDHGEGLLDGQCTQTGHGNTGYFNYPVAALAWLSDTYIEKYPEANQNLRLHAGARLTTANTFNSLAGLAHITYRNANIAQDIFDPSFRETPRLVNVGESVVDWDHAQFAGVCRKPTTITATRSQPDPIL